MKHKIQPLLEVSEALCLVARPHAPIFDELGAAVPENQQKSRSWASEADLHRKNSLFFGNDAAGERFAVLYSLIATCQKHDVNPVEYLTDVLLRVQDHPKTRIAELLPHRWKERFPRSSAQAPATTL